MIKERLEGRKSVAAWKKAAVHDIERNQRLTAEEALPWVGRLAVVSPYLRQEATQKGRERKAANIASGLVKGLKLVSPDGPSHKTTAIQALELAFRTPKPVAPKELDDQAYEITLALVREHMLPSVTYGICFPSYSERYPLHLSYNAIPRNYKGRAELSMRADKSNPGITLHTILNNADLLEPYTGFERVHGDRVEAPSVAVTNLVDADILGLNTLSPADLEVGTAHVLVGADPEAHTVQWERVA